jgi:hypothetical protein
MSDLQLTLTTDERSCLLGLLEQALKNKRVEEHRTKTSSYRESLVQEEKAMESVLAKLRSTAG